MYILCTQIQNQSEAPRHKSQTLHGCGIGICHKLSPAQLPIAMGTLAEAFMPVTWSFVHDQSCSSSLEALLV